MTIASVGRVLLLSYLLSEPSAAASTSGWAWPIGDPHPVQAPFVAPPTPYASGHRGIDITARTGVAVSAAAAGVVTFSGVVVDRPLVVIRHDDGLVSSIEPVVGSVSVGDTVARGAAIGAVGDGGHCDGSCVHFGVRRDGAYINPLLLLGDVPAAVLLPVVGTPTASAGSGARVGVSVALLDAFDGDVGVDLGRRQARMTEQFLHSSQVGTAVEEMRRCGVSECVGPRWSAAGHGVEESRDERVDRARAESASAGAEEQCRARSGPTLTRDSAREQHGARAREVVDDRGLGGHTEGDDPLLVALARDADREPVEVEVVAVQAAELRDAERGGVEQFDDGKVAHRVRFPR